MKLAILGRSEGNGHPYSWSAILNGYDSQKMEALCPFPNICDYLGRKSRKDFGIDNARVTHIWTEDIEESHRIAECTLIDTVVGEMTGVIGQVDAVIIAEDIGERHLHMASPFLEQGIPVFIDKPLCLSSGDLAAFIDYNKSGKLFMSCSSARYAREYTQLLQEFPEAKDIRTIHSLGVNSWEKYGIHCLEALVPLIGSDFVSIQYTGNKENPCVYLQCSNGLQLIIQQFPRSAAGLSLRIIGAEKTALASWEDFFFSFKITLQEFINSIKEGKSTVDFGETLTLIKVLIAGIISREQGGKKIYLEDLQP